MKSMFAAAEIEGQAPVKEVPDRWKRLNRVKFGWWVSLKS
jgi:hypothetical protein